MTLGVRHKTGTDGNALKANAQDTLEKDCLSEYSGDGVEPRDLFMFHYDRALLEKEGIRGAWLQYYESRWSQPRNAAFAITQGVWIKPSSLDLHSIGTYRRFSQLDSELVPVNQMLKYIKFGFGQATDHACYDIREGNISREEGIALVKEFDGQCGEQYVQRFCDYIGITLEEFWRVANSFRGSMWTQDEGGVWRLTNPIWEMEPPPADIDVCRVIERLDRRLAEETIASRQWFEAKKAESPANRAANAGERTGGTWRGTTEPESI